MPRRDEPTWRSGGAGSSWRDGGGDGGGGFWRRFFAGFTTGNFLDWAFPIYTAWGIRVRVHVLYVLIAGFELISAAGAGRLGWVAFAVGVLFVLVLLHEYGHCVACRLVRGEADDILMWPLGGLAFCRPPRAWRADLVTTLAGPGVNLVLGLVMMPVLLAAGAGWGGVVFNPLDPAGATRGLDAMWKVGLWWAYYVNALLFLFNMLIPMFPMDAGRVLHALLWSRMGYRRSMMLTANIGLFTALVVGVFGLLGNQSRLVLIAVLGAQVCWSERQRMKFMETAGEEEESAFAESLAWRERDDRAFREAASRQQRERAEAQRMQAEEDRILAKIAREGMQSLTRAERNVLEEATRRRGGRG